MEPVSEVVACSPQESALVVTVISEQLRDFAVVQELRDRVLDAIKQSDAKNVVMDLSRVRQIGSVAFLAFLAIRRQAGIDRIILCNLNEYVQELFRMCKLIASSNANGKAAPFEQAETVQQALHYCN